MLVLFSLIALYLWFNVELRIIFINHELFLYFFVWNWQVLCILCIGIQCGDATTTARLGIYFIKLQKILTLIWWYIGIFMLHIRFIIILTYYGIFYYFYHGKICIYGLWCAAFWHKILCRVVLLHHYAYPLPILLLAQPSFTYHSVGQTSIQHFSFVFFSDSVTSVR